MKKYLAELFGTFLLALVVGLSLRGVFPVPTPVLAALTLGLFVYTAGHISGAHINPAVTIGIWSLGKIKFKEAVIYIAAQFVGATLALYAIAALYGNNGFDLHLPLAHGFSVAAAEFLGAVFFTFGIAAVVRGKVPADVTGLTIGGSLLLGLSVAASKSVAIINPAVALSITGTSMSGAYLLAPVVGAVAGMNLYKFISE